ncbi:DUF4348 domain-containing protein [Flavobacterium ustbae]|uniref:DUF4348 domain-containing protein n=1 Tax=Flavobacterium ustbae TaxID=2488790 RepID=UPI000F7B8D05|nr:DUF4348 domain-containing protein [Flavobacterium ustbae]
MKKLITILFIAVFCQLGTAQQKAKSNSENFTTFLKKFNEDKNFQLSRVKFPFKIKTIDDNLEDIEVTMTEKNYRILKLDDKGMEFRQKVILKPNKAVIEQRGIDTGIYADYIFELKDNKWFLKTWLDQSM